MSHLLALFERSGLEVDAIKQKKKLSRKHRELLGDLLPQETVGLEIKSDSFFMGEFSPLEQPAVISSYFSSSVEEFYTERYSWTYKSNGEKDKLVENPVKLPLKNLTMYKNEKSNDLSYRKVGAYNLQFCNPHQGNQNLYNEVYNTQYKVSLPASQIRKHSYIVAGTGSGKTELLKRFIFSIIDRDKESICILEPHGDLIKQVAKYKDLDPERLVYIDPCLSDECAPVINPFYIDNKTEHAILKRTQDLVGCFAEILGKDFSDNMEALLTPCIDTLLRMENASLKNLLLFMDDSRNEYLVERGTKSKNEFIRDFFKYYFREKDKDPQKKALKTRLQLLLNDPYFERAVNGKNTIDLEKEINKKGRVILFNISKTKMPKTLQSYGRFIVSLVKSFAFQRASLPVEKRPTTILFLDEFQNFITPSIAEILEEARKYNLFLTMAHQVNTQLTPVLRNSVISASSNIIVGRNSHKTLSEMTREIRANIDDLNRLQVGEFFFSINGKEPLRVKVDKKYINTENEVFYRTDKEMENVKLEQIKKYYSSSAKNQNEEPSRPVPDSGKVKALYGDF